MTLNFCSFLQSSPLSAGLQKEPPHSVNAVLKIELRTWCALVNHLTNWATHPRPQYFLFFCCCERQPLVDKVQGTTVPSHSLNRPSASVLSFWVFSRGEAERSPYDITQLSPWQYFMLRWTSHWEGHPSTGESTSNPPSNALSCPRNLRRSHSVSFSSAYSSQLLPSMPSPYISPWQVTLRVTRAICARLSLHEDT